MKSRKWTRMIGTCLCGQHSTKPLLQKDLTTHKKSETTNSVSVAAILAAFAVGALAPGQPAAEVYKVDPVSAGPEERHWPSLNDGGDVVWSELIGGVWQVVKNGTAITSGTDDKKYPSIDYAGNIVYVNYGVPGPSTGVNRQVVLHPSTIIEFSSRDASTGSHRDAGEHPDISEGEILSYYDFYNASTGSTVRRLNSSTRGRIDNDFLTKDFPTCLGDGDGVNYDWCAGIAYETFGFVRSSLDVDQSEPGSIPRASPYGLVFVDPADRLTIYKYKNSFRDAGWLDLGISRGSFAYSLDPLAPATDDPQVISSSYADIDTIGNIAFEQPGSGIYRGTLKAGSYTPVAISAGHGKYFPSSEGTCDFLAAGGGCWQRGLYGEVREDLVTMEIAYAAANWLANRGIPSFLPRIGDSITLPGGLCPAGYSNKQCRRADFDNRVLQAEARGAKLYIAVHTNGDGPTSHGALFTRPPVELGFADNQSMQLEQDVLTTLVERLGADDTSRLRRNDPFLGDEKDGLFEPQRLHEYEQAREAGMTVAYIEVAFHSNTAPGSQQPDPYPLNNLLLADPTFLTKAGEAIARGAVGYLVGVE